MSCSCFYDTKRKLPLLQHIQDKYSCKKLKHFNDKISLTTEEKECTGISRNKRKNEEDLERVTYENDIKDMFPDFGVSDDMFPQMSNTDPRNTAIIRDRAENISNHSLVHPPMMGDTSFLARNCQINEVPTNSTAPDPATANTNISNGTNLQTHPTDFFALIQFIRGAVLVNTPTNTDSMVSQQDNLLLVTYVVFCCIN